ncbi:Gfo/Idh/MocA family protein [Fulvivirga sedimenti]|uniref:Gfo/Idh/MocA family oxidoreductase n=1 Tax=Fulvivirga sedimenti TaxID=2879465 RepID=A0A9X1HZ19_9BACT|nr:Gfo/Idh/MocA family oxidoreductase [Fulvivirga sedimenti]MCA6079064.1 Gfo/Idh/MocA family oxidoreductase [Fulvivirga sedimenti]
MKKKENRSTRRKFIKTLAATGLTFSIVPRHVLGGSGFVAPSDTLRIAGIGVGGKGYSDLAEFAKSKNVKIAALCDVDDRRAERSIKDHQDANYYHDYRIMLEKEGDSIDAVSVSTPDHMHAIQALAAMEMGKHVYVQKPLTHDIYEARQLTEAAHRYKVVTQMGNQGASGDGVRQMQEWYRAGLIGKVHTVYVWTNRPVWPQGIAWPDKTAGVPAELKWDLWLGTAPYKEYVDNVVPFNWRGWWDYGTGALGDMACHLIEPAFKTLQLGYPTSVQCSVGSVYTGPFQRAYYPDSCPPSSHIILEFPERGDEPGVSMHWMDGGIQPARPSELEADEIMGDGGNGVLMIGTEGKMMCSTYGANPRLIPLSRNEQINVPEEIPRVPEGHYLQWVNACMAGYGKKECSSDFDIAGPLTESVLMGNLALRSYDYQEKKDNDIQYPGRNITLLWDGPNMKITNFEPANTFVKREYRTGW